MSFKFWRYKGFLLAFVWAIAWGVKRWSYCLSGLDLHDIGQHNSLLNVQGSVEITFLGHVTSDWEWVWKWSRLKRVSTYVQVSGKSYRAHKRLLLTGNLVGSCLLILENSEDMLLELLAGNLLFLERSFSNMPLLRASSICKSADINTIKLGKNWANRCS